MNEPKQFLSFIERGSSASGKTKVFNVINLQGEILGEVKWYGNWRKYCFFSHWEDTIYDNHCLRQILEFVEKITEVHKTK